MIPDGEGAVVIAPDSFKDCMAADEVAIAIERGVRAACPGLRTVVLPLADGGEGTAAVLACALGASAVGCRSCDPARRPVDCTYYITTDGSTAVADVATAGGIRFVRDGAADALSADSYGTGVLLRDAIARGCRRIILGLGGSGTTDCGKGLLEALGASFYDASGNGAHCMTDVARADLSGAARMLEGVEVILVCDVDAPLYGPGGAACVFAPQKGASPAEVGQLDAGLRRMAGILGIDADVPGVGAAGGIAAGLLSACAGVKLRPGAGSVLDATGFDTIVQGASLVVTGEGHIDRQTLMGKLPYTVMRRASGHGVPVVAVAGRVDDRHSLLAAGFSDVVCINDGHVPTMEAAEAGIRISRAVAQKLRGWC